MSPILAEATLADADAVPEEEALEVAAPRDEIASAGASGSKSVEAEMAVPGGGVEREGAGIPAAGVPPEVGCKRRSKTWAKTLSVRGATFNGHGSTDTGEIPSWWRR